MLGAGSSKEGARRVVVAMTYINRPQSFRIFIFAMSARPDPILGSHERVLRRNR
jgi:hypothetical protein